MIDTETRELLRHQLHDLDSAIEALRVQRQYATSGLHERHLDERITECVLKRAAVADALRASLDSRPCPVAGSSDPARRAA